MNDSSVTCGSCRIGTLHRRAAPYAAWHGDEFVVLPSAPIWVCDVCAERTYDQQALEYLLVLLGPVSSDSITGQSSAHRATEPSPPVETDRTRRRA